MKVISINVRGLGTKEKKQWISSMCLMEKASFVGIQETKLININEVGVELLGVTVVLVMQK